MSLITYPDLTERLCLSMLPLPKTPSKVDDGIERVKQSLSTKWGIEFPIRDATPSKRDKSRVEEKILGLIQFLYFKDGALGYAIEQFENNAIHIVSQWQFKPHGEPDVLPSFAHSRSALKEDFLRKQRVLSTKAVTELTESLKCFLNSVADRVKAGEKFSTSFRVQGMVSHLLCPALHGRLKPFQMTRSPRTRARPPSLISCNTIPNLGNVYDPKANLDQQRAESRQLCTPRPTIIQTTR